MTRPEAILFEYRRNVLASLELTGDIYAGIVRVTFRYRYDRDFAIPYRKVIESEIAECVHLASESAVDAHSDIQAFDMDSSDLLFAHLNSGDELRCNTYHDAVEFEYPIRYREGRLHFADRVLDIDRSDRYFLCLEYLGVVSNKVLL